MALELFLGHVVEVAISKVISLATEQINLGVGYKKELESFCTTLNMINGVLRYAEQNGVTDAPDVKTWLEDLREIADEAAAVMDEIAYETLRSKVGDEKPKPKQVSNLFCFCSPVIGRREMANKIKELDTALDELNKKATGFGFQQMLANTSETKHRELVPQTDSLLGNASEVIGRDVDVQNIVSLLIDSSKFDQPLGVVSIVGVGGMGKTTLVKLVCNNEKVQGYFSKIMWVCVSEKFEVESILGEMLQSLTSGPRMDIINQDTVVRRIREELQDKNCLLVLDDVWDVDGPKWVSLRNCLMGITESVGSSRVLVTTRLQSVPAVMSSVCRSIQKLDDDECWSIIKQQAFGSSLVPPELEAIGQKIAMKCKGVPLVAKSIGGTLYNCENEDDWLLIEKKFDATDDDGVLQALKLSFDRLPRAALKQCFAFCSIFPKDVVMEKEMLIQLWMAEGFLEALDSSLKIEDVGENYFQDLVSYSFFQDVERDNYGSIVSCKMHDLMYDLAKSISKSEILVLEEDTRKIDFGDIRHLNLICAPSVAPTKTIKVFQKLHSLFMKVDISCDTSINFKKLLALSFCGADISELPSFLGKLECLRFLDISKSKIKEIPKFINKLYLLQTFRFMNCWNLEKPPEEIENLVSLKHICFNNEKHVPSGIGSLTCLQTLEIFAVGHQRGYQIQELEHLSQLRGKLEIRNLENIRNREDAGRANLCAKTALVELTLEFGSGLSVDQCKHHCDILESLEPHSNLKGLSLERYGGEKCPSWMSDCVGTKGGSTCLSNLSMMKLYYCPHLESIPSLSLSEKALLEIHGCKSLKSIEVSLIQNLRELSIWFCDALTSIPSLDGCVSLEIISIFFCPQLKSIEGEKLSSCMSLRKFSIVHCHALTSIPSLDGLLSIERIFIWSCLELKSIKKESLSLSSRLKEVIVRDWHALTSLSILPGLSCLVKICISDCKRLKSISGESLSSATHLGELTIESCPSLASIPSLDGLSRLESLCIRDCGGLTSLPDGLSTLHNLTKLALGGFSEELDEFPDLSFVQDFHCSLKDLTLVGWKKLKHLPHHIQCLTALRDLTIQKFDGLQALPDWLENFSSLWSLSVRDCSSLTRLPDGLSSLRRLYRLELGGFSEDMEEFPDLSFMQHLHDSLYELTLVGWVKLKHLPHQIQCLKNLTDLTTRKFDGLEVLPDWLGNLSSLKVLKLIHCNSLKQFPSMEAMRRLSKLINLEIESCAKLNVVSEGDKITGVKRVVIDNVTI